MNQLSSHVRALKEAVTIGRAFAKSDINGKDQVSIAKQSLDIAQHANTSIANVTGMVIITDGYENASQYFDYHEISKMIGRLDETGKWTFSFLGADFDAIHTSKMMNIREENVMNFSKGKYKSMMYDLKESISDHAYEKRKGNLKRDIFDKFRVKDRRNN